MVQQFSQNPILQKNWPSPPFIGILVLKNFEGSIIPLVYFHSFITVYLAPIMLQAMNKAL